MSSRVLLAAAIVAVPGGLALAQNVPEVGEYNPDAPVGRQPAQPQQPPAPTIITIGPDGKPIPAAEPPRGGVVHYDSAGMPYIEEDPVEIHGGPTPELHVVRRGDTLWDICWYYFNDPWQWPKVWSYNGQITNPHWIYPGDLVRLLPKGFLSITPDSADPGLEPETDPQRPLVDDAPTPVVRQDLVVRQVAFIDKKHLDSSMFIVGAVDDKELLATGDEVYVSYPEKQVPKIGDRYSIYAEDRKVEHKDKAVGSYVLIRGELEILSVKQDKRARARILNATSEIERGSRVGPLMRQFKTVPPVKNEVDVQGTIVAMLSADQLIGQGEVVFIDLGKSSGLKPGNRMFVVRRGDAFDPSSRPAVVGQDDRAFPARALGQVVVIQVGDSLSVGLVDRSVEEMGVGDLVMMRKQ
jgi:hypothetical protein